MTVITLEMTSRLAWSDNVAFDSLYSVQQPSLP